MKDLSGKVVVITGASGGLGRAAAIAFAKRGCTLVLAARRTDALEETAKLCREAGGIAHYMAVDVSQESDIQGLTQFAIERAGRIDVWVNNAGVTLFGRLDEAPFAEHRRVIETNLFGAMLGARAVAPIFRRQKQGIIINVGSVLSNIGQPFVPSYVISKFALRGLSEALRSDFADEPDVHICSLFPYTIDTPHFQSGANRVGRDAHAMPPVQAPETVAEAMVALVERPRRQLFVPRTAALGLALHAMMPRTVERLIHDALHEFHFGDRKGMFGRGNIYEPTEEKAHVHGSRPPVLSAPALFAWALGRFFVIQAENAARFALRAVSGAKGPLDASKLGRPPQALNVAPRP